MTSCWFSSNLSRSERGRIVVVHRRDGACCGFAVGGGFSGTSWWFRRGRGFTVVIALLGFLRLAVLVVTVVSAAVAALGGDDVMCLLLMGETEREMRTEGQCGKRRNKIKIPSIKKKKTMYLMVKKQFGII